MWRQNEIKPNGRLVYQLNVTPVKRYVRTALFTIEETETTDRGARTGSPTEDCIHLMSYYRIVPLVYSIERRWFTPVSTSLWPWPRSFTFDPKRHSIRRYYRRLMLEVNTFSVCEALLKFYRLRTETTYV